MTVTDYIYPANPSGVPASVTQPSGTFKKEVSKVTGSIVLFLLVYLLMFVLSILLVIGCVYGGIAIIINVPRAITILIGLGFIGLGIMVFVFLVKFLFAVTRFDRSGSIEITEREQPRLYAFIRQLTQDTQTRFPKKIYLSPDVNASVFYDSSFWSMFFPVKKNLQIGLGLVNSLNVSEFKAVMAHEFGHFSQRSMKLGSFVYSVNKIIFNMLYDNNSYNNFLQGWANIGSTFAFFATLTAKIATGIQWVLRQMYGLINRSYMSLSREMEFHADAVAASVSGSKNLVTALRRVELADAGYNIALRKCDELFRQKIMSKNIYDNQRVVFQHIASEFKLPLHGGLPVISNEFLEDHNRSRVNYKDQWASHPSTEDREKYLNGLAIVADVVDEPAWTLFDNPLQLQAALTQKLYGPLRPETDMTVIGGDEFEEKFYGEVKRFSIPDVYNRFYDNRQVPIMEAYELDENISGNKIKFSAIFSDHHAGLYKKIQALATDIEVLKAISDKRIQTKTFDFDGNKHQQADAATLAEQLEKEKVNRQKELDDLDRKAILFFLDKAKQAGVEEETRLKKKYTQYFERRKKADEFLSQVNSMLESLGPIYSGRAISIEQINSMIAGLKNDHEIRFKGWLKGWLALGVFENAAEKTKIEKFIESNYAYFSGTEFFNNELAELNEICNQSWNSVRHHLFDLFREILDEQLKLLPQ